MEYDAEAAAEEAQRAAAEATARTEREVAARASAEAQQRALTRASGSSPQVHGMGLVTQIGQSSGATPDSRISITELEHAIKRIPLSVTMDQL